MHSEFVESRRWQSHCQRSFFLVSTIVLYDNHFKIWTSGFKGKLWATTLESISIRSIKIIRTKLMKDINTSILQHKDFKSIRKSIYWKKENYIRLFQRPVLRLKLDKIKMTMLLNIEVNNLFMYISNCI